jgi:hypothetical protein
MPRPVSSHLLASRGIGLARILGEVESIFKEHYRGLNHDARDFRMLARNASSMCYVTYGRLISALLQQVRSALRITFFPGQ